jgi:hypothetical protein
LNDFVVVRDGIEFVVNIVLDQDANTDVPLRIFRPFVVLDSVIDDLVVTTDYVLISVSTACFEIPGAVRPMAVAIVYSAMVVSRRDTAISPSYRASSQSALTTRHAALVRAARVKSGAELSSIAAFRAS